MSRDEETFNPRRKSVINSSVVGNTLNSTGLRMFIATSSTTTDSVMLTTISRSIRNAGSGVTMASTIASTPRGTASSAAAAGVNIDRAALAAGLGRALRAGFAAGKRVWAPGVRPTAFAGAIRYAVRRPPVSR